MSFYSRRLLVLFLLVAFGCTFAAAQCTPATSPAAKICSPVNGGTYTSPVSLVVGTADAHPISAIYTYVDNVVVNKTYASSVNTTVNIASGSHNVRVQVWDSTGAILRDSVNITVTASSGVTIAVSPTNATMLVNTTQQFTATVTGTSNTGVTWSVDGVNGGNSTTGTISSSGLYTAPAAAGSHTVRATSVADTTKFAQASVSVVTQLPNCTPSTDPGAKICSPANGSTDASPVHVVVGTKDTAHRISAIYTYVDNVVVNKTYAGTVDTTISIAAGSHILRVQAWDTSGAIYRDSVSMTVASGPPQTTVTVSPSSATVAPSATQQFTATVTNNSNTSVTWSVDGVAGGNSTVGTVDPTGLYTAPSANGTHTVTATSVADTTKSGSATVTVGTPQTTVTVSPSTASVVTGGTKQFTATVTNNSNTSVTWSVDSVAGGNSTVGTVSASGLYTAPSATGTHTVTATSAADTTKSGHATVTVTSAVSSVTISPKLAVLTPEQTQQFTANTSVNWSVDGVAGGDSTVGTISSGGLYTPPSASGSHQITGTSTTDSTKTGNATAHVTTYAGTFTYHNDNSRTGQNTAETVLSPSNVNSGQFGKLFSRTVDGFVFAQPLYVRAVNVSGVGARNVVYVATEHASVYAFDADGKTSSPLWKRSFINPAAGINPVTGSEVNNFDLGPEAGITSTPVIDAGSGTMYVLVRTNENGTYFQRLHAISLASGADTKTAVVVSATVNGSGVGGDGSGHIAFNPLIQNQRTALLMANNNVYVAWASHGDNGSYHGWIMAFSASTLQRTAVLNLTPNGKDGGVWGGGSGTAADSSGNIFLSTGNGTNDVTSSALDFGDSYLKTNAGLAPVDYFTPFDQSTLNSGDLDLGASGLVLLPDQSGAHPHVMVGSGKRGDLYVVDRDSLGGFHSGSNTNAVQYLPRAVGLNSAPDQFFGIGSYWNGNMYFAGSFDHLRQFTVSAGLLSTSAVHTSPQVLSSNRAAEPVISADGSSNGIVWVIATDTYTSNTAPAVLHAYDASNVGTELWNSAQNSSRDAGGKVVKFTTPTVANGRVYMGTRTELDVYGLLP